MNQQTASSLAGSSVAGEVAIQAQE